MPLNPVQVDFINQAARQHMETVVRILHELDIFAADYDALQGGVDALPEDGTVLDDAEGGAGPRADAPELTGLVLKQLRDFSASMSAVVTPTAKDTLISRMVRSLGVVLKV